MILLPAIDIIDGHAVRLDQGDYARRTDYYPDPVDAARRWVDEGASELHIVDLDGARTGTPANLNSIYRIVEALEIPIELGGGLRSDRAVHDAFSAGAARAILGTAAFKDSFFLERSISSYGEQIVVSVDAREGTVAAAGWLEDTDLSLEVAFEELQAQGASRFVYSSIEKDGMMTGPDLDGAKRVDSLVEGGFVYSGGVGTLADLEALGDLGLSHLRGVIVGKALFERRFTVAQGQAALAAGTPGAMTHYKRVIPCLDVDNGRVVKGVGFVDIRDAGDPVELARAYDLAGADELVFLDITATSDKRDTVTALARAAADDVFVPFTIGGGVRSVADAQAVLDAGADKVSVNSAAIARPELLSELADVFGAQCVVLAIDAKRRPSGSPPGPATSAGPVTPRAIDAKRHLRAGHAEPVPDPGPARPGSGSDVSDVTWEAYVAGGRTPTGRDAVAWAMEGVARGAGEILLTSMDQDGVGSGYDLELVSAVSSAVAVPVIASGGAGELDHLVAALQAGADAVLCASIFHYGRFSVADVKAHLAAAGIAVRRLPDS